MKNNGTWICGSLSGLSITNTTISVTNISTDCILFTGGKICSGLN